MKISSIPKAGRKGAVVYLNTRHGKVARQYVCPCNPRTPEQQGHRNNVRAVTGRWRTLSAEQRAAWCAATANTYFVFIPSPIPKGLCLPAQGWEQRATLGVQRATSPTLKGLYPAAQPRVFGQGSDTTLSGLMKAT